jgi:hypothetical protein
MIQWINEFICNILVGKWHEGNSVYSLSHYLKMTQKEYATFIEKNKFPKKWILRLWKHRI